MALKRPGEFVRWYDQEPELSALVQTMSHQSSEDQRLYCRMIIQVYTDWREAQYLAGNQLSIGPERHMALHKSKNKRRWYDEDPLIHRAFNYLYILDEETRYYLARQLNRTTQRIKEYRSLCMSYGRNSSTSEIRSLIQISMSQTEEATQQYLSRIFQKYEDQFRPVTLSTASSRKNPTQTTYTAGSNRDPRAVRF
jgi:hypothetical protein